MTISSNIRKAGPFTGNGSTAAFPFYFKVFQASDLLVVQLDTATNIETTLALTTNYTVSLNADQDSNPGGTVTLVAGALAVGYKLTITSDIGNLQPTDLTNQGGFYPEVIEDSFDRSTIQIQQLAEDMSRALIIPLSSTASTSVPYPEANTVIGWNSTGTALENLSAQDLATAFAYSDWKYDVFTGDSTTTQFAMQDNPGNIANLDVSLSGVTQLPGTDYTISGNILTFTTAPPTGVNILARYGQAATQTNVSYSQQVFNVAAFQTVFTLSSSYSPGNNSVAVYLNGSRLAPGLDYTETSSNSITLVRGAFAGDIVMVATATSINPTGVDAAQVTYSPAGTGAVATNVQTKLRETVSVKDFGAVGDGVTDDTAAMQAAHNTGKLVFYPVGVYLFNTITIGSGGISGEGKQSILKSTNTTTANLITYTGTDPSGLLVNTDGGLFQNFTVIVNSPTQKSDGAAIYVSRAPNENYLTIVSGVYTKNVPIGIDFSIASFFSVRDCYFSLYSVAGLRTVIDSATFADNGDNEIIGNWFYTTNAIGPSSFSMIIRCGGTRIIGNKINGGLIGIDVKPIRSTSIAIIEGNSIENQIINGVRAYIANDFIGVPASGEGFSFVQVVGNQIGGYNLAGGAIAFDSFDAANYKFYNCLVSDNIIYNPANTSSRAIDIRATDRFIVSNNFVDNATVGYGSLFVSSNSTQGLVTRNQFLRAATSNILNSSTTTKLDEIIADYSTTYNPPSINSGATHTLAVTVTGATLGNYVSASFSLDLSGITLSAYVSAADTVTFAFFNGTAAPIDLASGTIRARVISN